MTATSLGRIEEAFRCMACCLGNALTHRCKSLTAEPFGDQFCIKRADQGEGLGAGVMVYPNDNPPLTDSRGVLHSTLGSFEVEIVFQAPEGIKKPCYLVLHGTRVTYVNGKPYAHSDLDRFWYETQVPPSPKKIVESADLLLQIACRHSVQIVKHVYQSRQQLWKAITEKS